MPYRELRLLFVFFLLCASCGWGIRDHLPDSPIRPSTPPVYYRLDTEASAVEYRGNNAPSFAEALEVRDAIGELLRGRARAFTPDRRPAPPARFRAVVEVLRTVWPYSWTIACMDLQVVGCPTGSAEATVSIELQVGNAIYVGRGGGSSIGGLYYNGFTGTPRAIGKALEAAVESLTYGGVLSVPNPSPPAPLDNNLPSAGGG
jgi:hypothetical protein